MANLTVAIFSELWVITHTKEFDTLLFITLKPSLQRRPVVFARIILQDFELKLFLGHFVPKLIPQLIHLSES